MKIPRILLVILFTFISGKSFPCLNGETKVLKNGFTLYEDVEGNVPYGHNFEFGDDNIIDNTIKELDSFYKATKDLNYLSDKGLLLIILKQYEKAIKLYQEIEKIQPGRYATASNMGTAYELAGNNEAALKWISRSIEIDSTAHNHSEWIHVKILEAKLKGEEFISTQFLLNTDFGANDLPITTLGNDDLRKLSDALFFQLNERVSFVKPKDKIVAQLLFDLGNIAYLLGDYYDAKLDYEMAKEYGFDSPLLKKRLQSEKVLASKSYYDEKLEQVKNKLKYFLIGIGSILSIILFILFVIIKRRKN